MRLRYGLIVALIILAVVVIAGWWARGAQARASEAEGRYQTLKAESLKKDAAVEAHAAFSEARDRQLVERIVTLQAREVERAAQLAAAHRDTIVAADRAAALQHAPLADVLRAGEELGIKARAR